MTFESFDPLEEAAWQHSLSPTAHTDRVTQRKRDFLAGAAWMEKNSRLGAAVQKLQSEGHSLVAHCDADGKTTWKVVRMQEFPAYLGLDEPAEPGFADPLVALLDWAVSK